MKTKADSILAETALIVSYKKIQIYLWGLFSHFKQVNESTSIGIVAPMSKQFSAIQDLMLAEQYDW